MWHLFFNLSDIRFHSYGKNEEEEAFAFHRNDLYRGKGAVYNHFNFIAAGCAKRFEKIAVIEAHINGFAFDVAFYNVADFAESGGTGNFDFSASDGKADGAFESVVDKKACSVDGVKEISYFYFNNGIGRSGNGRAEIDEISFEKTGNNVISSYAENNVFLGKSNENVLFAFKKFGNFGKGFSGNDEIKFVAIGNLFLADRKAETVHGNNGKNVIFDNEFGTGMNGFEIVYGYREDSLVDHALKGFFFNGEIDFFVNGRNLGELLGFDSDDIIFCGAAADFSKEAVVAFDFDFFGSKAADHIKEKFCVKNDGTVFGNSGGHISGDAKLHVIAAESEAVVLGNNEDAFHCRMGGFRGNGTGYVIERFGKFLAAARKFHKISSR